MRIEVDVGEFVQETTDHVTATIAQLQGTRHWEDHPPTFGALAMVGIQLSLDISRFCSNIVQLANSLFGTAVIIHIL